MPSVERLEAALRECVAERQALHEEGAGRAELEENRLELVRLQSQLSRDLIYRRMGVTGRSRESGLAFVQAAAADCGCDSKEETLESRHARHSGRTLRATGAAGLEPATPGFGDHSGEAGRVAQGHFMRRSRRVG
jgi:hypothetical protein